MSCICYLSLYQSTDDLTRYEDHNPEAETMRRRGYCSFPDFNEQQSCTLRRMTANAPCVETSVGFSLRYAANHDRCTARGLFTEQMYVEFDESVAHRERILVLDG